MRLKWLLLPAVLAADCIFLSWTVALATGILLLLVFVLIAMWNNRVMEKQLCGKTRTIEVEAGMLKSGIERELYHEISCSSITEVRMTRHLLMLGFHQASKVIAWYPIPLRVFADEQERDSFLESVRNPHTAVSDMGEYGETSVTEMGIGQSISGKSSAMIPWESLLCAVETDNEIFFYQKDQGHYTAIQKKGMESQEQIESLKGLCREKRMEVLVGKRKKYAPGWLIILLTAVVIVGYLWLMYTDFYKKTVPDLHPLCWAGISLAFLWVYDSQRDALWFVYQSDVEHLAVNRKQAELRYRKDWNPEFV